MPKVGSTQLHHVSWDDVDITVSFQFHEAWEVYCSCSSVTS